jgi:drug/metabolite transporter (DMT)-like permease
LSSIVLAPSVKPELQSGRGRMHLLMLFVVVCWASNIIAGKLALTRFSALALAQLRVLGAAAIFTVAFLATRRVRRLQLSRRKCLWLVAMAASGIALNQLTFIGGMALSTAAHTGLIVALGPVMVLLIAVAMRMEILTLSKTVGMVIAFAGVGILTVDKAGQGSSHWTGDVILLVSTLVFAIFTILVKQIADKFDALTLNTLIFAAGALMMLPFCAHAVVVTNWTSVTFEAWWGVGFIVIFGSVISYLLFARVMTELPASRAAAFNYLQPVIASGLGVWLLSERLTLKVVIGGALILAGVYLTEWERGGKVALKTVASKAVAG